MNEKPKEDQGNCAGCGAAFMGRATDKFIESLGWRKINGKWHCNFCTGAGYAGMYRKEEGEP